MPCGATSRRRGSSGKTDPYTEQKSGRIFMTSRPYNEQYTAEAANVATGADVSAIEGMAGKLAFEETGDFFDLLAAADYSLAVTREYEHFLLAMDGTPAGPLQSAFPLPHPSGFWFDRATRALTVASTRTPNILLWFTPHVADAKNREIMPADYEAPAGRTVFLPRQARYLPGSLYIHELIKFGDDFYATVTGHNFLAKLTLEHGWERVWWPHAVDGLGPDAFNQNYFQLNSIAANGSPEESFFTGFSDQTTGAKPWKQGYGPDGKGVVFSGRTRQPLYRGLTCPHSARLAGGKLWVCNSGYGSVGYIENFESHDPERTRYVEVARAPGFTRGLAIADDIAFVGLSKIIKQYEPYAPGLKSEESRCGIWAFRLSTGEFIASVSWPEGYQVFDLQLLRGVKKPMLPMDRRPSDGINPLLRFLG